MERLKDQVAIVTGGAQGLGEAIAHRLAREGCRAITIADVKIEKAHETAEEITRATGAETLALQVDVTNEEQVEGMTQETVRRFGALDLLVANAGILIAYDITEFPAEAWRRVIDVNLFGYFLCARAAARVMVKQRKGNIIQINSKSGKKGSFRNSAYSASKFGGIGLTQSIALDLAPYGVRVNAVCPGNLLDGTLWQESLYEQYARTQGLTKEEVRLKYEAQVPLGRGCTYDDVCNVVVFLASDEASYMTGQAINVTGGQEMR
ncbi:MAG TPA: sorbitol-6-phosphate dehydrogenase [Chthonomonas sp.]|uniref:sorbitol-6-phosphate dehydrogenase n=1 Tax=Chthonomonas sp. TaxID=2282153 RepID=UPI002B4B590E|nr:sorbitol-6-phosphate dehydrogenase [Chthonomonas sp.]HLI48853.1 sorbitol-6-phosphate dehydrogenase [Chthonomonas sp.]